MESKKFELKSKMKKAIKKSISHQSFSLVCSIIIMLILFAFLPLGIDSFPTFYDFTSFSIMLSSNSIYGILAVGIMIVLITGGIDISVGSILAISAVSVAKLAYSFPNISPVLWIFVGIIIGIFCGFINGILIGKFKLVPLIVTAATMFIYRGLAFLITGGEWFIDTKISNNFKAIAKTQILGFDSIVWILVLIIILAALFLNFTEHGRKLFAVGSSEVSSEILGINIGNTKVMAYTICGGLAGLAGVLFVSNDALAHSQIGLNYEMTAIAICVIAGVSTTGGRGKVICLVLGIFFMSLLSKLLASLGAMNNLEDVFNGAIIIIAVMLNMISEQTKIKKELSLLDKRL